MDTNFIHILVLLLSVLIGTDAQLCSRRWRRLCYPDRCHLVRDIYGEIRQDCLSRVESLLLVKEELGRLTGLGIGIRRDYPLNPGLLRHGRVPGVIDIGGGRHIHVPTAHDRRDPIQLHVNIGNTNLNNHTKTDSGNVDVSQAQAPTPAPSPRCIPCGLGRVCPRRHICVVSYRCPSGTSCRRLATG